MSTYSKAAKNVAAIIFMGYGVIIFLAMFVFLGELQPGLVIFSFYWTFFSLILVAVTACARFAVNDPFPGAVIRFRNPSKLKRLIVDSHTGEEIVVSGDPKPLSDRPPYRTGNSLLSIKKGTGPSRMSNEMISLHLL